MKRLVCFLIFILLIAKTCAQRDSIAIGDRYAEDQIYTLVGYSQFTNQPQSLPQSQFSYSLSSGFIKDITLNKKGNISLGLGIGYGFNNFKHSLKIESVNNTTLFSIDNTINSNTFKSQNLEFPFELRWRTSNAIKYKFWRIYSGIKFLYNLNNRFHYLNQQNTKFSFSNIPEYNKLQYGLTLSAGYDAFNLYVFYSLTPLFNNAQLENEVINIKILKIGFIFYIL